MMGFFFFCDDCIKEKEIEAYTDAQDEAKEWDFLPICHLCSEPIQNIKLSEKGYEYVEMNFEYVHGVLASKKKIYTPSFDRTKFEIDPLGLLQ